MILRKTFKTLRTRLRRERNLRINIKLKLPRLMMRNIKKLDHLIKRFYNLSKKLMTTRRSIKQNLRTSMNAWMRSGLLRIRTSSRFKRSAKVIQWCTSSQLKFKSKMRESKERRLSLSCIVKLLLKLWALWNKESMRQDINRFLLIRSMNVLVSILKLHSRKKWISISVTVKTS